MLQEILIGARCMEGMPDTPEGEEVPEPEETGHEGLDTLDVVAGTSEAMDRCLIRPGVPAEDDEAFLPPASIYFEV
jgi:hypothetical protein